MRLHLAVAIAAVAALTACSQTAQNSTPTTDEDKTLYALGVMLSRNIQSFDFTDAEIAMVKAGLDDSLHAKAKLEDKIVEEQGPKLQELQMKRMEAAAVREKEAGTAYLAKMAEEKGATKLPSGLVYKVVSEGTGDTPKESDTVSVNYEGKLVSGKLFDGTSLHDDQKPSTFPLTGVIPCWTEGLQQMKVGGKAQLICPPDLAYGEQGRPPQMPGNATLTFDVELLEIVKDQSAEAADGAHAAH